MSYRSPSENDRVTELKTLEATFWQKKPTSLDGSLNFLQPFPETKSLQIFLQVFLPSIQSDRNTKKFVWMSPKKNFGLGTMWPIILYNSETFIALKAGSCLALSIFDRPSCSTKARTNLPLGSSFPFFCAVMCSLLATLQVCQWQPVLCHLSLTRMIIILSALTNWL